MAGGTSKMEAVWAIVDHGVPIPVTDGYFLARQPVATDAVPVELLDGSFQRLA